MHISQTDEPTSICLLYNNFDKVFFKSIWVNYYTILAQTNLATMGLAALQ